MENTTLDSDLIKQENSTRRRNLLPWWIKIFVWIFLLLGFIALVGPILGLLNYNFHISIYGFEAYEPLSTNGIYLIMLFLLKGITAFGLWTEKDWAITLGQIDAILGIIICAFMMIIYPFISVETGSHLNIRLELILLIPFLIKLNQIKKDWKGLAVEN